MKNIKSRTGEPLKSRKLVHDDQPADPVVVRLLLDIQLALRSRQKVACGLLGDEVLPDAATLERGAFRHLLNYLDAKAWVRNVDDDLGGASR